MDVKNNLQDIMEKPNDPEMRSLEGVLRIRSSLSFTRFRIMSSHEILPAFLIDTVAYEGITESYGVIPRIS